MIQWHLYPRRRSRLARAIGAPGGRDRRRRLAAAAAPAAVRPGALTDEGLSVLRAAHTCAATSPSASCSPSSARSRSARVLIFMIDMVELLRMSRRATDLSDAHRCCGWALLRLPAFSEILLAFAVHGRQHRRAAQPQPQVRADRHARGRHVGVAVPAPGPDGRAAARHLRRHGLQSAGRRRPLGVRAPGGRGVRQGSRACWRPPARARGCARTAPTANPS